MWVRALRRSTSGSGFGMGDGRGPPCMSQADRGRCVCHNSCPWSTSAAPAPTSSCEIAKMKEGRCAATTYQIRNIFCFLLFDLEHSPVRERHLIYCRRVWLQSLNKFCAKSSSEIRGQTFRWIFQSSDLCRWKKRREFPALFFTQVMSITI